jgi:hypothetical protein
MDPDLIDAEIEVLRMLAGQLPFVWSVAAAICIEELARRGFCTANAAPRITPSGLKTLELATGTIDLGSRVASRRR